MDAATQNGVLFCSWLDAASELYGRRSSDRGAAAVAEARRLRDLFDMVLATSPFPDLHLLLNAHHARGECFEVEGDFGAAIDAYRLSVDAADRLAALQPGSDTAFKAAQKWYSLGLVTREEGQWAEAHAAFDAAKAHCEACGARPPRGVQELLAAIDRSRARCVQLERADVAQPARLAVAALTDASTWEECKTAGNAAYAVRLFEPAVAAYTRGLAAGPPPEGLAALHANISACHTACLLFPAALAAADAAVQAAPEWSRGYERRAAALNGLARFKGAALSFRKAAEHAASPAAAEALLQQAAHAEAAERDTARNAESSVTLTRAWDASPLGLLDARIARRGRDAAMPPGSWARTLHDAHAIWNDAVSRLVRWGAHAPEEWADGGEVRRSVEFLNVARREVVVAWPEERVQPTELLPDLFEGLCREPSAASVAEHVRGVWLPFSAYYRSLRVMCCALTASGSGVHCATYGVRHDFESASEAEVAALLRRTIRGREACMLSAVRLEATSHILQAHAIAVAGQRDKALPMLRAAQRWCAVTRAWWASGAVTHCPPLPPGPPQWANRVLPCLWLSTDEACTAELKYPPRDAPPEISRTAQVINLDTEHCFFFCKSYAADAWLTVMTRTRPGAAQRAFVRDSAVTCAALRDSGMWRCYPSLAADAVLGHAGARAAMRDHAGAAAAYEAAARRLEDALRGAPRAFTAWADAAVQATRAGAATAADVRRLYAAAQAAAAELQATKLHPGLPQSCTAYAQAGAIAAANADRADDAPALLPHNIDSVVAPEAPPQSEDFAGDDDDDDVAVTAPPARPAPRFVAGNSRGAPQPAPRDGLARECAHCGAAGGKLRACSACNAALFCGRDCQLAAWPAHKAACKAARKAAAAAA